MNRCTSCGWQNRLTNVVCADCGAALDGSRTPTVPTPLPPQQSAPQQAPTPPTPRSASSPQPLGSALMSRLEGQVLEQPTLIRPSKSTVVRAMWLAGGASLCIGAIQIAASPQMTAGVFILSFGVIAISLMFLGGIPGTGGLIMAICHGMLRRPRQIGQRAKTSSRGTMRATVSIRTAEGESLVELVLVPGSVRIGDWLSCAGRWTSTGTFRCYRLENRTLGVSAWT